LDLIVSDGTLVYWTGNVDGVVVDRWAGDAAANVVVEAGGYDVVFGHLSRRDVKIDDQISYGTQLGETGQKHLHLGVRANGRYYNPLYFFIHEVASTIETKMGPYSEGENAWSMRAYTYSGSGECGNYYWGAQPDRTGIER
jgi:murein DD-endopeptidase MepM/ murein hydrolase activator NlpD